MLRINTHNTNPNFTIVLPGACQAKCNFCEWEKKTVNEEKAFLAGLEFSLENLPDNFKQISISGGEPLLSPVFDKALRLINKYKNANKFNKVVLTTNGNEFLNKFIFSRLNGIDFVNISRHAISDITNEEIFETKDIPNKYDLHLINSNLKRYCFTPNINCVVTDEMELSIFKWIDFLESVNVNSISFRNQYNDFSINKMEAFLRENDCISIMEECPVCETTIFKIGNYRIKFHKSSFEPTEVFEELPAFGLDEVYEVILQSDGVLSSDWKGNKILHTPTTSEFIESLKLTRISSIQDDSDDSDGYIGCGGYSSC